MSLHGKSTNSFGNYSFTEHKTRDADAMRSLILFAAILLMSLLVYSTPINPKRLLINRPKEHYVLKRSAQVKGAKPGIKGYNPPPPVDLRKGEFMCGSRVCKLKPGEIPRGCNGVCQYPLNPMP